MCHLQGIRTWFGQAPAAEAPLGEDTSDESESEVSRYVRKRRDLVEAARTVFADAGDAFGSLRALKARARCFMTVATLSGAHL